MSKQLVSHALDQIILTIRGHRVILDADLAKLYGVPTGQLNRALKRNAKRFPDSFAFQLKPEEVVILRCQTGTSSSRGTHRYPPIAFTGHGALMAAIVVNSPTAIKMSIALIKAVVRFREMALSIDELFLKVKAMEKGFQEHGHQCEIVFEAIRELMAPPVPPRKKIGLHPK